MTIHPLQAAHSFVDHKYVSGQSLCEEEDPEFNYILKLFHSNNNLFLLSL